MSGTNAQRVEKGHRKQGVGGENLPIEVANIEGEVISKENILEQLDTGVRGRNKDEGGTIQREMGGSIQGEDEGCVRQGDIIQLRDETDERKGEEGGFTVMEASMFVKHPEGDTKGSSEVKGSCQHACKQDSEEVEQGALQRIPLLDCTNSVALSEDGGLLVGSTINKKQWKRRARMPTDEENL